MDQLAKVLADNEQQHLLKFFHELDDEESKKLETDIKTIDWQEISKIRNSFMKNGEIDTKTEVHIDENDVLPLPKEVCQAKSGIPENVSEMYIELGNDHIKRGRVAALVLAGGQGTRLGVDYPKGMLDVGLLSHKSLFQLQAERIKKLADVTGQDSLFWYIMTSPATDAKTKEFFKTNGNFGLRNTQVVFFEQDVLPAFSFDGKIFLEDKHKVSKSPSGNGSLFSALKKHGILDHMIGNEIDYIHVYCVDNILVRVCDPIFMGYCIAKKADAGSKAVEKQVSCESLGTICKLGQKYKVIEYSEIPKSLAEKKDISGKLVFNAGNICEQFFSVKFLVSIASQIDIPYHIAVKKIPCVDMNDGKFVKPSKPNGVKFEKFIFDFLEYTDEFVVWLVDRKDEFSPIKNPIGSFKDNPTTARDDLLRLHSEGKLDV